MSRKELRQKRKQKQHTLHKQQMPDKTETEHGTFKTEDGMTICRSYSHQAVNSLCETTIKPLRVYKVRPMTNSRARFSDNPLRLLLYMHTLGQFLENWNLGMVISLPMWDSDLLDIENMWRTCGEHVENMWRTCVIVD